MSPGVNPGELEILLAEDSEDDMELAIHALKRGKVANQISVVRDGEEALDFLFCRGAYDQRSFEHPPKLVLLDLKLPKVDGMEVLRQVKGDPRTKTIPLVESPAHLPPGRLALVCLPRIHCPPAPQKLQHVLLL